MEQNGLFDYEFRMERLSELGDSLEKLDCIDWEMFREPLQEALKKEPKGAGGRPAYDVILMFKIIVLQRIYNLSDDQTEYQINDRLSFMRFLGFNLYNKVPDAKTIWHFKDTLAKSENKVMQKMFDLFNEMLESHWFIKHEGVIVDATFVEAKIQRNTPEENKQINCSVC